ncbi:MAG: hypothetical protein AAF804_01790 [Bacteroidota bacterium]
MVRKLTSSLVLLLLTPFISAQDLQYFTVVDLDSSEPIAYATVSLASQPERRTLSNENGGFILTSVSSMDTLVFSHVSYGQPRIAVAEILRDTIRLQAKDFTLDEVAIVSETGEAILRKVIKASDKNHDFNKTPYFSQSWVTVSNLYDNHLHAFVEVDGSTLWHRRLTKHVFAEVRARSYSWTSLGDAWLKDKTLIDLAWGWYFVGGGAPYYLFKSPRKALEAFNVEIEGCYREGKYTVARLALTSKQSSCNDSYTLHVDLDSYEVVRFQKHSNLVEYQGIEEYGCPYHYYPDYKVYNHEYEERFVEIGGNWHRLYLKRAQQGIYQGEDIITEELNFSQLTEWDASKEKSIPSSLIARLEMWWTPIDSLQIPWDDSYWQSRPSVPWPDRIAERLEAEGVAR